MLTAGKRQMLVFTGLHHQLAPVPLTFGMITCICIYDRLELSFSQVVMNRALHIIISYYPTRNLGL